MSFYARLKKGIVETPRYGKWIYPGDNWIELEDKYLALVQADSRLEIKDQKQMNEIKETENDLIQDIVNGQWRQSEKRINTINDVKLLEYRLLPLLVENNKNKLIQITKDRIEELTVIK